MAELYCALDQVKSRVSLGQTDSRFDEILEGIVEAVCRAIDAECGTHFYAVSQTRYFPVTNSSYVIVDDLLSIDASGLKTGLNTDGLYDFTWTATDYVLAPYNAPLFSQPRPYWIVERAVGGDYSFTLGARGVQITGSWGFCTTQNRPKQVELVALRESVYHFHAIKSPYGMTGPSGEGTAPIPPIGLSTSSKGFLVDFRRLGAPSVVFA